MQNLLTSTGACDDARDMDTLFRDQLAPLLQKFKYRLSQLEQSVSSKRLQDYTRAKMERAYQALETLDKEWQQRWQDFSLAEKKKYQQLSAFYHSLDQSMTDLAEKYKELEQTLMGSDDYFEKALDDTIDAMMNKIEEIDARISDAVERTLHMRQVVHEKINAVKGLASEHMDHLKHAVAKGAKQLLHYEELPVPWRNNMASGARVQNERWRLTFFFFTVHSYWIPFLIHSGAVLALAPLLA